MATIPSIAMIPSGYKANKVYSVLPTDGSGDLDFARTTKATRVNSDGLIEEVLTGVPRLDYTDGGCPSLLLEPASTNLITQSEAFGNSYWTKSGAIIQGDASTAGTERVINGDFATDTNWNKSSNWTISGGTAIADGSSNSNMNQGIELPVSNKTYIITYTISNYTSGTFKIQYGGAFTSEQSSNGTFTEQITALNIDRVKISGSLPFGSIDNISIKEVQGFSAPSVDSPLGAFKLVEDSSNGLHRIRFTSIPRTSGSTYTISIYAKPNGRLLYLNGATFCNASSTFDLSNGTIANEASGTSKIELLSSGYYKCSVTGTATITGSTNFFIQLNNTEFGDDSYQGDGTSGVYIFGSQLEAQSSATSYIKTSGTTISRTADTANGSGNASTFNDSEGVLYAEISALADDETIRAITLSDGTISNYIALEYSTASNRLIASTSVATFMQTFAYDITNNLKCAFKYKENDFALWVNGVEVVVDALGGLPSNLSELAFDRGDGGSPFYGKTKDVRVYNTALTDSELQTLTTI